MAIWGNTNEFIVEATTRPSKMLTKPSKMLMLIAEMLMTTGDV